MSPRATTAVVIVAIPIAWIGAEVAWLAGQDHRDECRRAGRVSCSLLPWDHGQRPPITPEQQQLLREARDAAP